MINKKLLKIIVLPLSVSNNIWRINKADQNI